ncbi:putative valyl-tRNA synthetase, partial [Trypanosoma cruzi]
STVTNGNLDEKEVPRALKLQKETFPNGIPECGSDALRFGLLSYTQSGRSVNLDIDRIVAYRQFCNKLWNAVRYVLYHALGTEYKPGLTVIDVSRAESYPLECRWILSRLDVAVEECTRGFSEGSYDFALTTNSAYRFWLYELCDVFLELTKFSIHAGGDRKQLVQDVLLYVVEVALRLLHPMMPFLTEELWHRLPNYNTFEVESIMLAPYPAVAGWKNDTVEEKMRIMMDTVHNVRSTKASYSLTNKHKPDVWITAQTSEVKQLLMDHSYMVISLGVVGNVSVISPEEVEANVPKGCGFSVVNKEVGVNMMLLGFIDVQKEVAKLDKQLVGLQKQIEGLKKKMSIPNYDMKVPADVRTANSEKLDTLTAQEKQIIEGLEKMRSIL